MVCYIKSWELVDYGVQDLVAQHDALTEASMKSRQQSVSSAKAGRRFGSIVKKVARSRIPLLVSRYNLPLVFICPATTKCSARQEADSACGSVVVRTEESDGSV